jgi:hypothetical protein
VIVVTVTEVSRRGSEAPVCPEQGCSSGVAHRPGMDFALIHEVDERVDDEYDVLTKLDLQLRTRMFRE